MPRKSNKKLRKIPTLTFQFSDLWTVDYRLITALLIALPLLIYAQVYDFAILWDDKGSVGHLYNPFVESPSWESFGQLLAGPYFGMYIPVTYFLWGVLKAFAEFLSLPLSSVLHLTNVAVHIINGLLVFVILKQFVLNKWAVLVGTLFFLLHPIQVESVAFISEFRSLLAFGFSLSALYVYLKNQADFSYLSLLLFILAILSKPSAVVLVLFIFTLNYFHYGFKLGKNITKTLPFALTAFLFILNAYFVQFRYDINYSDYVIAIWQRPFAWLDSMVFYLAQLIYPYHLSVSYTLSSKFITQQWWFYPLAFLPLGMGYWLWLKRKTYPMLIFATLLFMAGFFTTSGLLTFAFQKLSLVADRYLYFAMIGVALLIATMFSKADKKLLRGLIIAILLVFALLSAFRQIPVWHNPIKLWSHARAYELTEQYAHANLAVALYHKGSTLQKAGNNKQSLIYFNKAIKYAPKSSEKNIAVILGDRGILFFRQQKYQKALADFTKAVEYFPASRSKNTNKIHTLIVLKKCKQAHSATYDARKNKVKLKTTTLTLLQKNCPNR
ncbi:FOG: TPR repeat [uncultured Candidatus Thioglobus sp.]|nr:FOG: TPR repeat [uncultured Candidatus Thioglobus sp.]